MLRVLLMVFVLAGLSLAVRTWLLRQSVAGRVLVSLSLLSIAMYTYGYALYGACRGEVDFLRNPFACTRHDAPVFNPNAWRIGRAR